MSIRSKLAVAILAAALLLGAAADTLFKDAADGLNVPLFVLFAVLTGTLLVRIRPIRGSRESRWLALPVLAFAACFAWRASPTLHLLDGCAVILCVAVVVLGGQSGRLCMGGLLEYGRSIPYAASHSVAGLPVLLRHDIDWTELGTSPYRHAAAAVLRGVMIAVPLLVGFGALFCAADAVFGSFVNRLFAFDSAEVSSHCCWVLAVAWATAGALRSMLLREGPSDTQVFSAASGRLGILEVGTALALLDVLFLVFVMVQVRYLFAGSTMLDVAGLTYAEYARRGFFEIVAASTLALPVLLTGHHLLREEAPGARKVFGLLAGLQVALLFVILASALLRMHLYQQEYGLTELRFYTTAFMAWLGAVFAWFAAAVLSGRREWFGTGAVLAGLLVVGSLNVANPDAIIIQANAALARAKGTFDASYACSLSADAVPTLVERLPELPGGGANSGRTQAAAGLLDWLQNSPRRDWRGWNLDIQIARNKIQAQASELQSLLVRVRQDPWQRSAGSSSTLATR